MKKGSWTSKNGTINTGIVTTSCVPNHKPKRARKSRSLETSTEALATHIDINITSILSALISLAFVPVDIEWKIFLSFLFLLSSFHVTEVK